jgi:polymorphic membrane protein
MNFFEIIVLGCCLMMVACDDSADVDKAADGGDGASDSDSDGDSDSDSDGDADFDNPLADPPEGPPAGNPDGDCKVPTEAAPEDVSNPTTVVGSGTAESCTADGFVDAVANGGIITFDCGPDPVTITLDRTAKIVNDTGPKIVIDGGGLITLSGGGNVRILYMNTCDEAQKWTTSHCQDQDHPQFTLQNLTFVQGNAEGEEFEGGGAVFVRGGRFKVVNCRFFNNVCDDYGPDVGGAAVRVLSQYQGRPVYIVNSTFGGETGLGNVCSNGGGLSSIGVSYTVINSLFSHNSAIGHGANPAREGTPGGGSGGGIYCDGNTFVLTLCGVSMTDNTANEGGGAIFFVSNDRSGSLVIEDSVLSNNPSDGFETQGFPGIFVLAKGDPEVTDSIIE